MGRTFGSTRAHLSRGLEAVEQVIGRGRPGRGLHLKGDPFEEIADELARLKVATVEQPGLPGLDPADRFRRHPVFEQPQTGVDRGLAAADDNVAVGVSVQIHEVSGGHARNSRLDLKRGRRFGGDGGREVPGVDDPLADVDLELLTREPGDEAALGDVLALREEADLARRDQALPHHPLVVSADLGGARTLIHAGLGPIGLAGVAAERRRVHAVVPGGLVQADEGIGAEPVPARCMSTIDHHELGVGLLDERVGECHAERPASDDEVIRSQLLYRNRPLLLAGIISRGAQN